MSNQNASFHIRNRTQRQRNRHSLSPRTSEFGSMRLSRAMMPPTNSGISPSQLNFSNIPNGGSSNLGRAVFAMNSPTRSTINANLTKMTDSPQSTPLSITSIMSISPLGHNRAARKAMVKAKKENDSMIYIEGPQVYTCSQCRTHLTSHDDIISKSFHGRHGRAYLFDQCVNVYTGPHENRRLMTGLHTVCDIHCKRCKRVVGWTYSKAYEQSQKYKEGKFVIEKINLHLEESEYYTISHPAGERDDRWRKRSMSWGSSHESPYDSRDYNCDMVYEYDPVDKYSKASINDGASSPTTASSTYFDSVAETVPQPRLPDLGHDTTL